MECLNDLRFSLLASRFSLLALIALFSLITPKFASAQYSYSFGGYTQCATGSTSVILPSGTVVGANTHCWYVYGPGNSNNWPSPTNPPPPVGATGGTPGSGGTSPPPPTPPPPAAVQHFSVNINEFDCALDVAARAGMAIDAFFDYGVAVVQSTVTLQGTSGDYQTYRLETFLSAPDAAPYIEVSPVLPGCISGSGNNGAGSNGTYIP